MQLLGGGTIKAYGEPTWNRWARNRPIAYVSLIIICLFFLFFLFSFLLPDSLYLFILFFRFLFFLVCFLHLV